MSAKSKGKERGKGDAPAPADRGARPEDMQATLEKEGRSIRHTVAETTERTDRRLMEQVNRRLAEITRNARDGVILTDAEGRTTYVNPAFEEMTGYREEELLGRDPADLIVADDTEAIGDEIRSVVREKGQWAGEALCRRKNGEVYPVETRVFAIRNAGGELVEIAAIQQDISERRRAESALRDSEQRYRTLFTDSPISLWEEDFSEVKKHIDNLKNSGVRDFRRYFGKHPEDVGRCAAMVRVVDVNRVTLDLYEAESKEDLKNDLRRLFTGETYGTFREELIAIAEGKTSFQCDCYARTLKRMTKYTSMSWSVPPGREDDFSKVLVSIVDITERKMAEKELTRYALVYRAMDEALVISSNDGIIIDVNPAAEKMYGWARDELVGRKAGMINPPELADQITEDINRGLEKEGVWRGEVPLLTKSGERRALSTVVSSILDSTGKQIGTIGINRDITEQKQLEEKLRHAQKMKAVGLLAGGIAHDFNNVLAGIVGYASLLKQALGEESPLYADAEAIVRLSHRGADLPKALLAFARKGKYNPRLLNVNEVIASTLKLIRESMGKGVEIQEALSLGIPNVVADEVQLQQVVMNLCINACEFMQGGGAMTVRSACTVPDEGFFKIHDGLKRCPYVLFSVSDTGPGMDDAALAHIFEPFFSTKKQKSGAGLGLSTVIGIVEGHDGCIEVKSDPGRGSIFTVYLPATEGEERRGETPAPGDLRGGEGILVIDDETDFRRSTRRWLEGFGYTVFEAADGKEALGLLEEKKGEIALVLLDMVMRGMRGSKTFEELNNVAPDLPVIICTGYSTDISRQMLLKGASDIIQKPFDPDDLIQKVRAILNKR